jgi:hypothetical protein
MTRATIVLSALAGLLAGAIASPAQAQTRVFVAAQGSDGNPCTFAAPCRTFQHAHDTVAANGEIDVLDPASYGPLTITKSISIQGHGFSGISVGSGANGITINAGAADVVNLNGLIIDGAGAGLTGIIFNSGGSLAIENCVVRRMTGSGPAFTSAATGPQTLTVSSSSFSHNHLDGIHIATASSGMIKAILERVMLNVNRNGLVMNGSNGTGAVTLAVTDSVASLSVSTGGRTGNGVLLDTVSGKSLVNATLTRMTISGNGTGVQYPGSNGTFRLAQCTITDNGTGYASGTTIGSFGDNYIDGNGSNIGGLAVIARH